jgi:hypothetical protein
MLLAHVMTALFWWKPSTPPSREDKRLMDALSAWALENYELDEAVAKVKEKGRSYVAPRVSDVPVRKRGD